MKFLAETIHLTIRSTPRQFQIKWVRNGTSSDIKRVSYFFRNVREAFKDTAPLNNDFHEINAV